MQLATHWPAINFMLQCIVRDLRWLIGIRYWNLQLIFFIKYNLIEQHRTEIRDFYQQTSCGANRWETPKKPRQLKLVYWLEDFYRLSQQAEVYCSTKKEKFSMKVAEGCAKLVLPKSTSLCLYRVRTQINVQFAQFPLGEISFYCQFRILHNFDIHDQFLYRRKYSE